MKPILKQDWMGDAKCLDADPELFFPENAESPNMVRYAQTMFCNSCPVRAECYEFGMRTASHGIWGGVLVTQQPKQRLSPKLHPLPAREGALVQPVRKGRDTGEQLVWFRRLLRHVSERVNRGM